jgi:large repetitive protein
MRRFRSLPVLLVSALALVLVSGAGATTINPGVLPAGTTDTAYSQTLTGVGGTGPYTFSVTAGALPPGLSLSSAGVISGTPTSSGNFGFTATAVDSLGAPGSQAYVLSIAPATLTIDPTTLYPGARGIFQEDSLTASGGTSPYTFAVTSGALPAGITLDTDGYLSGVPGAAGSYTFTVRVTDAHSSTGFRTYTLDVNLQTLNVNPLTLTDGTAGVPYVKQLTGAGGTAPYTFSVGAGSTLAPGLALSANGSLTGTPSAGGTFSFGVKITDSIGATTTRTYVFRVALVPLTVTASLPDGAYGKGYDTTFAASGGTPQYSFSLAGGTLPPGLTFTALGGLSGTPTASGTFVFSVTAVDKYADTGTFPFTLQISPATIGMTPSELFAATSGLFYGAKMNASGGLGTYTYVVSTGALPAGLVLAADGTISGIPDAVPGLYTFTVRATDTYGATGTKNMTLKLATPYILVSDVGLPTATVGVSYQQTLDVTGGTGPYSYSLLDGTPPSGLSLSTTGILSGAPTSPGTSTFTVLIVDANGVTSTQSFRLVVEPATPTVVKKPPKKVVAKHAVKKKVKKKVKAKH